DVADGLRAQVRGRADLQCDAFVRYPLHQRVIVDAEDAVADALWAQVLDDLPHVVDAPLFAGVDGDAQSRPARALDQRLMLTIGEVGVGRPGDVDADDAAALVAQRLLDDDGVDLRCERAIHHEDQAGARLWIFEQRAILPTQRGGDDMVEVALAAAVAL